MLVGINNLISIATKPQSDITLKINKAKSNIEEINYALSQNNLKNIKDLPPALSAQGQPCPMTVAI